MKTIYLLVTIFSTVLSAKSTVVKANKSTEIYNNISRQLASMISYPKILGNNHVGGIVVVEFYLTDGVSISRVKVFSESDALNFDIIRQLTGKKLSLTEPNLFEKFTVKLVFKNQHVENYKTGTKTKMVAYHKAT